MSRIIFDEPAGWQRPGWQVAAAAVALVALAIWWAALSPVDHEPIARHTPAPPLMAARSVPAPAATTVPAAAPLPAAARPVASAPALPALAPPLSTMVAPGVHITPLSVPPGTVPVPAGPSERDSEPEN
jgi:hypothetical protein